MRNLLPGAPVSGEDDGYDVCPVSQHPFFKQCPKLIPVYIHANQSAAHRANTRIRQTSRELKISHPSGVRVRSGVAHLLPCVPHKGCVNSGSGIIIRQVPAVSGQAEENTSGESRTRHSGARRALHRPIFPAGVTLISMTLPASPGNQKLAVRCSSSGDGCSWKGQLSSYASHQELCQHKVIPCPFRSTSGCKWEGRRCSITDHLVSEVQDHATAALAQIKDLRSQLELAQPPSFDLISVSSPPSSPLSLGGADSTSEALRSGIHTPSMFSPSSDGLPAVPAADISFSLHAGTTSWVPCPMVKVQVKAHNQFWPRRKGFVTETMGRECKVITFTTFQALPPSLKWLYYSLTVN